MTTHDASSGWPDSCTLDASGRATRTAELAAFFATAVTGTERPEPGRLRLQLRPGPQAGQQAGALAAAESQCCSFFTFTLTATAGRLTLDIAAPPARAGALDALAAHGGSPA